MHSMTVGKKLLLSFGGLVALLAAMSWASLSAIGTLKDKFDVAINRTVAKVILTDGINIGQSDMLSTQRGLIMMTYAKDTRVEAMKQAFRKHAETVQRNADEMMPLLVDDEGRRLTAEVKSATAALLSTFAEIERLCAAGDPEGAIKVATDRTLPVYDTLDKAAARLTEIERARLQEDKRDAAAGNAQARWTAFGLLGFALAVGAMSLWVVRGITGTLHTLVGELSEGAEQVASAAAQVSASSQALAQGASEQAASLEETSSSTEEIHSMTRKNAENSQTAAQVMMEAASLVSDANRRLEQMVGSMKEITTSSDKISKIIKVIDEIAFQTNILALNAAVEAARAGEAGMGFAVVADEVRNLAQRCAQAAKDTAGLIEESITRSGEGSSRLNEVAESIRSITESSGKAKDLVEEINLGSQEQSRGIEQVAKAVTQMEQVTQKTAANAEESASAGEELSAQSEGLRHIVDRLSAMVGAAAVAAKAPRRQDVKPKLVHAAAVAAPKAAIPLEGDAFHAF